MSFTGIVKSFIIRILKVFFPHNYIIIIIIIVYGILPAYGLGVLSLNYEVGYT